MSNAAHKHIDLSAYEAALMGLPAPKATRLMPAPKAEPGCEEHGDYYFDCDACNDLPGAVDAADEEREERHDHEYELGEAAE